MSWLAICTQCGAKYTEKEHEDLTQGLYFVCPCGNMDGNWSNACDWKSDEEEDDDEQVSIG